MFIAFMCYQYATSNITGVCLLKTVLISGAVVRAFAHSINQTITMIVESNKSNSTAGTVRVDVSLSRTFTSCAISFIAKS